MLLNEQTAPNPALVAKTGVQHPAEAEIAESNQPAASSLEPPSSTRNRCTPEDIWPMDWYASPKDYDVTLPALGELDQSMSTSFSYCQTGSVSEEAVRYIRNILQIAIDRTPGQPISLGEFPSTKKLDYCIDHYFAHFHKV
jgi:hypothetical protein